MQPQYQVVRRCQTGSAALIFGSAILDPAGNGLIDLLPIASKMRLLAMSEQVQLRLSARLDEPDQPTTHVYFPIDAWASLVASIDDHPDLVLERAGLAAAACSCFAKDRLFYVASMM